VDWVTEAGYVAGRGAAAFAQKAQVAEARHVPLKAGENIRYVVPHKLNPENLQEDLIRLQMRAIQPIEARVLVTVEDQDGNVVAKKGEPYARPGEILTLAIKPRAFDAARKASMLTVHVRKR
jgi:hypothetical protein